MRRHTDGVARKDEIETIPEPGPHHLPYRRRPQLRSFLGLGAVLGLILGGLVGYLGPDAPGSSALQELILLSAVGALLGGFLGAVAFLVADRLSMRK